MAQPVLTESICQFLQTPIVLQNGEYKTDFLYLCDDFCEPCFNSGHIQRLNGENKEIVVVIDFPVTCKLDSSPLIYFEFLCVCVCFF